MAARVTKQFLQQVLQHDAKQLKGKQGNKNAPLKKQQTTSSVSKKVTSGQKRKNKSTAANGAAAAAAKKKATERFLDAARKEQATADRTTENVQKLQVRASVKSQKVMAKALALRKKALH